MRTFLTILVISLIALCSAKKLRHEVQDYRLSQKDSYVRIKVKEGEKFSISYEEDSFEDVLYYPPQSDPKIQLLGQEIIETDPLPGSPTITTSVFKATSNGTYQIKIKPYNEDKETLLATVFVANKN